MVALYNYFFTHMDKEFKNYYVPNFPISRVTNEAMDGWIHNPNDQKYRYGFIEGILEHIENTGYCEPVRIAINSDIDIAAGPCGLARFYGFKHYKKATHIPALVNTRELKDWFGPDVREITTEEEFYSLFLFKPHQVSFEPNGQIIWWNKRPDPETARRTMKIKNIDRWIRSIMEPEEVAQLEAQERSTRSNRAFLL